MSFDVRAGLVVRQIHHWTADLFAATIVAHLCRIFFTGAFRRPREINWIIGLTMLILVIVNGFAGYSLPDDLLSATGLRIAYSVALSIPLVGTWLASLFFGGHLPRPRHHRSGCSSSTCCCCPGLIAALLGVHLAIIWRQKHTQYPGHGRSERHVVGSRLWPTYAAKSIGLFAAVFAVVAALGGLAQINPIWLYGPYRTGRGEHRGPARLVHGLAGGRPADVPTLADPPVGPHHPGDLLARGGAARRSPSGSCTCGRSSRRPSPVTTSTTSCSTAPGTAPLRTAIGIGVLIFYVVLFFAGSQDIVAQHLGIHITTVNRTFRILVFVLPVVAAVVAWKWCHDLMGADAYAEVEPGEGTGLAHQPGSEMPWQVAAAARTRPAGLIAVPHVLERLRHSRAVRVMAGAGAALLGIAIAVGKQLARRSRTHGHT